jgi:hypothetical protein
MAGEMQMLPGSPGSPAKLPSEKASECGSSPTTPQRRDEARAASVQRILEVPRHGLSQARDASVRLSSHTNIIMLFWVPLRTGGESAP